MPSRTPPHFRPPISVNAEVDVEEVESGWSDEPNTLPSDAFDRITKVPVVPTDQLARRLMHEAPTDPPAEAPEYDDDEDVHDRPTLIDPVELEAEMAAPTFKPAIPTIPTIDPEGSSEHTDRDPSPSDGRRSLAFSWAPEEGSRDTVTDVPGSVGIPDMPEALRQALAAPGEFSRSMEHETAPPDSIDEEPDCEIHAPVAPRAPDFEPRGPDSFGFEPAVSLEFDTPTSAGFITRGPDSAPSRPPHSAEAPAPPSSAPRVSSGFPRHIASTGLELATSEGPPPPERRDSMEFQLDSQPPSSPPSSRALELAQEAAHVQRGDGLKLAERVSSMPPAATPLQQMRDRFAMGDFTGALDVAEKILAENPNDPDATKCADSSREVLTEMFASRIGGMQKRVQVAMSADQIRWLSLDHRAGFLLSMVDGSSTVEELLDVSGMQRVDALRILTSLIDEGVVSTA